MESAPNKREGGEKLMKKLCVFVSLLCLVFLTGPSHAQDFWTGSVYGDTAGWVDNVRNFDWSSSGSGNASGLGAPGDPIIPDTQFTFRYQAELFAVSDPDGNTILFPGLNADFEYTLVTEIPEVVDSVTDLGGVVTATFKTLPGGTFYLYHDASPNSVVASGMGFDDGDLVASGTIDPDQIAVFTFVASQGVGIGSTILYGQIAPGSVNPTYLDPAITIVGFRVEGTLNQPPLDSQTAAYFQSRAGEGNLAPFTVGPDDTAFKVDTSSKFLSFELATGECRVTHGTVTRYTQDGLLVIEGEAAEVVLDPTKKKKVSPQNGSSSDGAWYNWSGQLGAPQANDPSFGENTIVQHNHPNYGDFTFHMGTNSASPGTEISQIECSDPGWCENARCAPFKQIFWEGIGEFENLHNNLGWQEACAGVAPKSGHGRNQIPGTLHYARGHATDFGEPAGDFTGNPGNGPQPSADQCVQWTTGGLDIADTQLITGPNGESPPWPGLHHGDKGSQECENCPDYFEFEIHCTDDPNSPVIWSVSHFITRGNIQIHPPVGDSCFDYYPQ
jgi:hypothetical protein